MDDLLRTPRGTRDIVGDEAELFEYLTTTFKEVAKRNGFKPIITPTIEFFELFARKSGVEIVKSMYVFKDKAGRTLALRPELTASVIRAYLKSLRNEPKPILLYYVGQCFRYEEPQRGRYREFWQAGLEVIGEKGVHGDLRVFNVMEQFFNEIKLKHYYIIGNVGIYRMFMNAFNIPGNEQDQILHLIDKEMFNEAINYAKKYGDEAAEVISKLISMNIEDLENMAMDYKELVKNYMDRLLGEIRDTIEFIDILKELGYDVRYKPSLVRGLAYYTGIIYEVKTSVLDISIGGGGRYDNLTTVYGGPPEYSTGVAIGIDRVMLALSELNIKPLDKDRVKAAILLLNDSKEYLIYAYKVSSLLQTAGITTLVLSGRKLSKMLSYANRFKFKYAVIIGSKELNENKVSIKDLDTGVQEYIELEKINEFIKNI